MPLLACLFAFAFTLLLLLCVPFTDYRTSPKPSIYLSDLQVCLFCGCSFIHSPISGPFPFFSFPFSFLPCGVCANNFYRYGYDTIVLVRQQREKPHYRTVLLPSSYTHTHTHLRFGFLHLNPTHTRPTCPTLLRTVERIANDRS